MIGMLDAMKRKPSLAKLSARVFKVSKIGPSPASCNDGLIRRQARPG